MAEIENILRTAKYASEKKLNLCSKGINCRNVEFSTSSTDRPLIVQFASHDPEEFALAAEMVCPLSDGVDLNCGCPQRWAIQEHYGILHQKIK